MVSRGLDLNSSPSTPGVGKLICPSRQCFFHILLLCRAVWGWTAEILSAFCKYQMLCPGSLISSDFTPSCFYPDMWGVACQRGAGDMQTCEEVVISALILCFHVIVSTFFPGLFPLLGHQGTDRPLSVTILMDKWTKEWSGGQNFWLWDSLLPFPRGVSLAHSPFSTLVFSCILWRCENSLGFCLEDKKVGTYTC